MKHKIVLKGGPRADTTCEFDPHILQFIIDNAKQNPREYGRYSRPNTKTHYMEWQGWHSLDSFDSNE